MGTPSTGVSSLRDTTPAGWAAIGETRVMVASKATACEAESTAKMTPRADGNPDDIEEPDPYETRVCDPTGFVNSAEF
jgi:hypothetical protein